MATLRRELIRTIREILEDYISPGKLYLEKDEIQTIIEEIADSILELRAFSTDKESPAHEVKRGSQEWKEEMGAKVAEKSVEAAVLSGQKLRPEVTDKNKEVFEFETMIDQELARLPLNWTGFQAKDQDNFRKFLKKQRKEHGRELSTFIDWWMSDEWRVANPPWKLDTIKIKWPQAFKDELKPQKPQQVSTDGEIHI